MDYKNEQLYMATMSLARQLLDQDIISSGEYRKIDTIFAEKYGISLGRLFSDISLIQ